MGAGSRRSTCWRWPPRKARSTQKTPSSTKVLGDTRSAAAGWSAGGLAAWDLNNDKFDYSPAGNETRHAPTIRLDVNLTKNHLVTFTGRHTKIDATPDFLNSREPRFPGFANFGGRYTTRYLAQTTVRSAFGSSLINEARVGYVAGKTEFGPEVGVSQFDCSGLGCQGGYNLQLGSITVGTTALTPATAVTSRSPRSVPSVVAEDALTWLKGRHQVSMGASFTRIALDETWTGSVVPGIVLTLAPAAPAYPVFTATSGNFPGGISDTYATYARNLYALLTGTVNQVNGQADLGADGQYKYLGGFWQAAHMDEAGIFVSDSWRLRSDLTLTAGARWELQLPFEPNAGMWARLEQWTDVYGVTGQGSMFKPGTMTGRKPLFVQFAEGEPAYNMDWNNLAPSVGVAWQPHIGNGLAGAILGRDPVFRGGYSHAYTRYGTYDLTAMYSSNPGLTRNMARSVPSGNLGADGLPVLLSQTARLEPAGQSRGRPRTRSARQPTSTWTSSTRESGCPTCSTTASGGSGSSAAR